MSSTDVDRYVAEELDPWQQEIVEALRKLVREAAPGARELISYGAPGWKANTNKLIVVVSPSQQHVVFSFSRGADFDDPYGLLEGGGKGRPPRQGQGPRRHPRRRLPLLRHPGRRPRRALSPPTPGVLDATR